MEWKHHRDAVGSSQNNLVSTRRVKWPTSFSNESSSLAVLTQLFASKLYQVVRIYFGS